MTQMQLLSAFASTLQLMEKNGMRVKDILALPVVEQADEMRAKGEQKCYIVQHLADEFGISVRSVYNFIDKLHREVKV